MVRFLCSVGLLISICANSVVLGRGDPFVMEQLYYIVSGWGNLVGDGCDVQMRICLSMFGYVHWDML